MKAEFVVGKLKRRRNHRPLVRCSDSRLRLNIANDYLPGIIRFPSGLQWAANTVLGHKSVMG